MADTETKKTGGPNSTDVDSIRTGLSEKPESMWSIYLRRFKKHTLGKIGFFILVILYASALFADFLSPFDMTWTDKTKSYHPPTKLRLIYNGPEGRRLRPYVFEQRIVNVAFKKYGVVPLRTIRAISIENIPGQLELRSVAAEQTPAERRRTIVQDVADHYRIESDSEPIRRLTAEIDRLERSANPDERIRFQIGTRVIDGKEMPLELWLAKGNKNFFGFFSEGTPYRFLGLFTTRMHFLTSPTGGLFILGTDALGRDIVSRLLHGSRVSLTVGLLGAMVSFSIGLLIGGIAGYAGGAVDNILMRLAEVVIAIPGIYLLFALRATFPSNLTSVQVYILIVLILSGIGWASLARIIRGLVLSIKSEDYVMSARTMGLGHLKIIVKHILPNTLSFVIIQATLTIPGFILGESALSLLGLGITEPQSSWGLMLAVARNYRVMNQFPWILVPGFFIFLAIMAWNFFGDGIRDSVDPRSRH